MTILRIEHPVPDLDRRKQAVTAIPSAGRDPACAATDSGEH